VLDFHQLLILIKVFDQKTQHNERGTLQINVTDQSAYPPQVPWLPCNHPAIYHWFLSLGVNRHGDLC